MRAPGELQRHQSEVAGRGRASLGLRGLLGAGGGWVEVVACGCWGGLGWLRLRLGLSGLGRVSGGLADEVALAGRCAGDCWDGWSCLRVFLVLDAALY